MRCVYVMTEQTANLDSGVMNETDAARSSDLVGSYELMNSNVKIINQPR